MHTQHIVYKKVGDLEISLTVFLPEDAKNLQVLLHLHGEGGLFSGNRAICAPHLLRSVTKYHFALVTADYRLAPQVNVLNINLDVEDCIEFIRDSEVSYISRHNSLSLILTVTTGSRQGAGKPWRHRHQAPRRLR